MKQQLFHFSSTHMMLDWILGTQRMSIVMADRRRLLGRLSSNTRFPEIRLWSWANVTSVSQMTVVSHPFQQLAPMTEKWSTEWVWAENISWMRWITAWRGWVPTLMYSKSTDWTVTRREKRLWELLMMLLRAERCDILEHPAWPLGSSKLCKILRRNMAGTSLSRCKITTICSIGKKVCPLLDRSLGHNWPSFRAWDDSLLQRHRRGTYSLVTNCSRSSRSSFRRPHHHTREDR